MTSDSYQREVEWKTRPHEDRHHILGVDVRKSCEVRSDISTKNATTLETDVNGENLPETRKMRRGKCLSMIKSRNAHEQRVVRDDRKGNNDENVAG